MNIFNSPNSKPPYVVAEVNTSHFGDINIAKEMIDECKRIGVDCVKFQSWTSESLYSEAYYNENRIAERFFKKYSMDEEDLMKMASYCQSLDIDFSSTPYSQVEADFLIEACHAKFIKIASMELNNLEYLKYIAKKNYPTILSTGMGEIDEIQRAVEIFLSNNCDNFTLLHCVSLYPCPTELCNLNNITLLREMFPDITIGYSDHTDGIEAAIAAVSLGANVIEKHFTLNNEKIGMDNQMATEPSEFATMVKACKRAYRALGSKERILSKEEQLQSLEMRRSAIALRDFEPGQKILLSDIEFKRPGKGIAPDKIGLYLGKKIKMKVKKGDLILPEIFNN